MKKIICIICSLGFMSITVFSQNHFAASLTYGSGNSAWSYNPLRLDFHDIYGNVDTTVFMNITGSSPFYSLNMAGKYRMKKSTFGVSVEMQHFYLTELYTQEILKYGIPVVVNTFPNPTPTHFKFSALYGFRLYSDEKLEILPELQIGTFIDDYKSTDTTEGFHWFGNVSLNLSYNLSNKTHFLISPGFDYSRFNSKREAATNDQRIWINIYSFYFSVGIKYDFIK